MRVIADFHIHSKYSRACSKDLDLEHIDQWARIKGIDIVGTGDFTHPAWHQELKDKLVEEKPGLFKLKGSDGKVLFILTTEISCIFKQGGKTRRLHVCIFMPSLQAVDKFINLLNDRKINLKSDGRPITGLSGIELAKVALEADSKSLIIPAHAWTPWFSVFGSYSGFDSLAECFGDMTKHIYAIETGLSSDPPMNWRLSELDKITLISNSDAHSPQNLGREANVFEITPAELSYQEISRILKEKDRNKFLYTIEFFPEEGKYHWDGHLKCQIQFSPAQTKKHKGICPVCKKSLTVGVLNRVDQLANRPDGYQLDTIPYKSLVPLPEIIAEVLEQGKNTKKVNELYQKMIKSAGNEFKILLDLSEAELLNITEAEVAEGIINMRLGKVEISPGYDGVYGVVKALPKNRKKLRQESLF